MDQEVLFDLAVETSRRCAVLPPDFPDKMSRRLRRKFKVKMKTDDIARLADGYASIYRYAASVLKDCLLPGRGEYASLADVDDHKYILEVASQFPLEDDKILSEIAAWVIYYEYLR